MHLNCINRQKMEKYINFTIESVLNIYHLVASCLNVHQKQYSNVN